MTGELPQERESNTENAGKKRRTEGEITMAENGGQCESCSKEKQDRVPIRRVIEKLDEHFSRNDLAGAGRLLSYWEREARMLGDARGLLEILNEEIGYFRRTGERERGLAAVSEAFSIMEEQGLCDSVSGGTIYVNGATTMKAFGKAAAALPYYARARKIYEAELPHDSYLLAALFNNTASAYAELGEFEKAEEAYKTAIAILAKNGDNDGEIAVSYVNLAHLYYGRDSLDGRIASTMELAWTYLMSEKLPHDGNYAFICSKCAPSYGFFGYFEREAALAAAAEEIYDRT